MNRLLAILIGAALCGPVYADPTDFDAWPDDPDEMTYHEDPGPGDAWFGRVVIYNRQGSSGLPRTFETTHGDVRLSYTVTPNHECLRNDCRDIVRVVRVPDGVMPSEWEVIQDEDAYHTIYLYEWLGG